MDLKAKAKLIEHCDLYYDMSYSVAYSTFANIPSGNCSTSFSFACVKISFFCQLSAAIILAEYDSLSNV